MRGLSSWTRCHVSPIRSSAPGAKFSTSTSQCLTSRSSTSMPFLFLESIVIERLLEFSMVKYRLSAPGTSTSWVRVISPTPARSTLITSAPSHASNCVHVGPDCTCVKSRMRTPSSALPIAETLSRSFQVICALFLANDALRIQFADAAALRAGRRIDHGVDDGRRARVHRRVDGALQLAGRRRIHAHASERLDHLVVARAFDENGDRRIGSRGIDVGSAIDAVVVEDDHANRQVVAADGLDLHAGEAEG